jgi:hypothetical protein
MLGRPRKKSGHTRGCICFMAQLHSNIISNFWSVLAYFKEISNKKLLCAQSARLLLAVSQDSVQNMKHQKT